MCLPVCRAVWHAAYCPTCAPCSQVHQTRRLVAASGLGPWLPWLLGDLSPAELHSYSVPPASHPPPPLAKHTLQMYDVTSGQLLRTLGGGHFDTINCCK